MLIYCGNPDGQKIERCKALACGVMISTSTLPHANAGWRGMPCALDNGAFGCFRRGFPSMPDAFKTQLESTYKSGVSLDFITVPDIVCGGRRSLDFSMEWVIGNLRTAPRLAFVVQDGMTDRDLLDYGIMDRPNVTVLFIGGSVEWKWRTAAEWVQFAHEHSRQCHIGRCGTLDRLIQAEAIGADSVDSASFARNDSWHIIDAFRARHQGVLEFPT